MSSSKQLTWKEESSGLFSWAIHKHLQAKLHPGVQLSLSLSFPLHLSKVLLSVGSQGKLGSDHSIYGSHGLEPSVASLPNSSEDTLSDVGHIHFLKQSIWSGKWQRGQYYNWPASVICPPLHIGGGHHNWQSHKDQMEWGRSVFSKGSWAVR